MRVILEGSFNFIKWCHDFQNAFLSDGDNDKETTTSNMLAFVSSFAVTVSSPVGFDENADAVVSVRLFCACVYVCT